MIISGPHGSCEHRLARGFYSHFPGTAQLGVQVPSGTMRRFWTMTAHNSGGIWNSSEIGRSLGEAHTTVKRHLDALSGALVVRVLEPWYANVGNEIKRVDAPTMTSSMVSAFKDLELHRLLVVYPGSTRYTLRSKVEVMSLAQCVAELA